MVQTERREEYKVKCSNSVASFQYQSLVFLTYCNTLYISMVSNALAFKKVWSQEKMLFQDKAQFFTYLQQQDLPQLSRHGFGHLHL